MDLSSNTHKAVALQIAAEILKQSATEPSAVGTLPIHHKPSVPKDPLKNTFHVCILSLLTIHSAELLSAEIVNIPGGQKNQDTVTSSRRSLTKPRPEFINVSRALRYKSNHGQSCPVLGAAAHSYVQLELGHYRPHFRLIPCMAQH